MYACAGVDFQCVRLHCSFLTSLHRKFELIKQEMRELSTWLELSLRTWNTGNQKISFNPKDWHWAFLHSERKLKNLTMHNWKPALFKTPHNTGGIGWQNGFQLSGNHCIRKQTSSEWQIFCAQFQRSCFQDILVWCILSGLLILIQNPCRAKRERKQTQYVKCHDGLLVWGLPRVLDPECDRLCGELLGV